MHLLTVAVTAVLCLATTGAVAARDDGPRHVTQISGTRDHGFHVTWSDGVEWWTPTLSEEVAECGAYDRAVRRARCEASSRTRHHWMGVVKRSLRHR